MKAPSVKPVRCAIYTRVSTEQQHVEWITECIAHMRRNKLATIEATPQAQDAWATHVSETPHPGEEILRDGNWAADWTPAEAATG